MGPSGIHHLRFFFEYGVDTALWPHELDSPYGYPCKPELLPISPDTRAELERLAERYQSSLDWESPSTPSRWSRTAKNRFNDQARAALQAVRRELGDGWIVEDRFDPL